MALDIRYSNLHVNESSKNTHTSAFGIQETRTDK